MLLKWLFLIAWLKHILLNKEELDSLLTLKFQSFKDVKKV